MASAKKKLPHSMMWLPKIRVAGWRLLFYRKAFSLMRKDAPDLTMADWVRHACDAQGKDQLGVDTLPVPKAVFKDAAG